MEIKFPVVKTDSYILTKVLPKMHVHVYMYVIKKNTACISLYHFYHEIKKYVGKQCRQQIIIPILHVKAFAVYVWSVDEVHTDFHLVKVDHIYQHIKSVCKMDISLREFIFMSSWR